MRNWRFMARSPLLLLACARLAYPQSASLPVRETLNYNIEWRLITAGKATVQWTASPQKASVHLESIGLVSKLFKVEDDYTVSFSQGQCAQASLLTAHEGNRRRETKITYNGETHTASYQERDLAKNAVVAAQDIEIPECVHDVLGGLYYLRTVNLEPGQTAEIPVTDGKKSVIAKVEAQQREDIKVPDGSYKTVRYEIYLFNNVLYRRPAHLYVWLTDDRRKLPVQIRVRMPITIGTVTLQLEKHE